MPGANVSHDPCVADPNQYTILVGSLDIVGGQALHIQRTSLYVQIPRGTIFDLHVRAWVHPCRSRRKRWYVCDNWGGCLFSHTLGRSNNPMYQRTYKRVSDVICLPCGL